MITYSATNCLFPTGWFAQIRQPYMSGLCFLCELRIPVNSFPVWTALPSQSTTSWSDPRLSSAFLLVVSDCLPAGLPQEQIGSPKSLHVSLNARHAFCEPRQTLRELTNPFSLCRLPVTRDCRHLLLYGSHRCTDNEAISSLQEVRTSLRSPGALPGWLTLFPVYASMMSFGRWCQKFVSLSCRLVEVAGIPASTPRFSLFDGNFSNRPQRPPSSLQHSVWVAG